MRIGIDIDDVLNNLTECVLEVYNKDSGDNLTIDKITEYDMKQFVKLYSPGDLFTAGEDTGYIKLNANGGNAAV